MTQQQAIRYEIAKYIMLSEMYGGNWFFILNIPFDEIDLNELKKRVKALEKTYKDDRGEKFQMTPKNYFIQLLNDEA